MDILAKVAEQKIAAAIARGELDNLSLQGQPIHQEDDRLVPDELRMGYKILKNAGILPEELQLKQELIKLQDLLDGCRDEDLRLQLQKKRTAKQLAYDLLMEKRRPSAAHRQYQQQIQRKLGF
ncbi:DUF1992 domain-containing protein [Malonomonas rubra]|uniref:DnaJ family domain-containing protein n=1 Tax=Malonomonas rubra TaxID=57040 RepID=UPI0026EBD457|nr:DUF1992 domain-containing protein [Malonomonas rubra]